MKLHITKLVSAILFLIAFCSIAAPKAHAIIPELKGRVINAKTGGGVPNVWVKLENNGSPKSLCEQLVKGAIRYELTDENGNYSFDPQYYWKKDPIKWGRWIDTNFDGSNDVQQIEDRSNPYCKEFEPDGIVYSGDYGCYSDPYNFSVIKPVNMAGTFTTVEKYNFPNAQGNDETRDIPDIIYTPANSGPSSSVNPTAKASPTQQPTPTPVSACTDKSSCSVKQVVNVNYSALGTTWGVLSALDSEDDPWIRLEIRGHQSLGNTPTTVTVTEQVNDQLFDILDPVYNASQKTFFITKKVAGAEQDITPTVCNGSALTCISSRSSSKVVITTDPIISSDVRNIYLKVKPKTETNSAQEVDNNSQSKITYNKSTPIDVFLDDAQVNISSIGASFFQTFLGNSYSKSPGTKGPGITSLLPSGQYFANKLSPQDISNPMVFYSSGSSEFGKGQVNERNSEVKDYTIQSEVLSYNSSYEANKTKIVDMNVIGIDQINAASGRDNNWRVSGDLRIEGSSWNNKTVSNKNTVIYVPGNLYIDVPFMIAKNGYSSLTFIVQGNIGISPDVTKVEGIYITDGVIDTACKGTPFNNSAHKCPPNSNTVTSSLELQGMFAANQGFNLDRNGVPNVTPGEAFYWRPDLVFAANEVLGKQLYSWKETQN